MIKFKPRFGSVAIAFFVLLAFAGSLYAQSGDDFTLTWFSVNPGDYSRGESWELTGVIGQPDAPTLSGGEYTLEGGFLHSYHLVFLPLALRE